MKRRTVAVVDHGAGNLASVAQAFSALGHRCRVSATPAVLAAADAIVLPGVGAFPAAMQTLHRLGLCEFLRQQARHGQPLIGICLGMQLLADTSSEHRHTAGLGLIPGRVRPLGEPRWHIGWNTIAVQHDDKLLGASNGAPLYFNHSYVFDTPACHRTALASVQSASFTVAVRKANVVGLQFHPEKSQQAGRALLQRVLEGLQHA